MAIQDRNLRAGTTLLAIYKKQVYTAEVIEVEGELRYQLEDGRTFKSPSSAGKAVMDGKACNGWAFWRLDSDVSDPNSTASDLAARERVTPVPKPQPKAKRGRPAKGAQPTETEDEEPSVDEAAAEDLQPA